MLRQLGLDVTLLTADDVEHGNLQRFGTIVLGIRAYDTREDVKKNNQRLLDYARDGGTLMVQYNTEPADFNNGNFTPYPAQLSRARVSVEESPVTILDPKSPVFHYPNPDRAERLLGMGAGARPVLHGPVGREIHAAAGLQRSGRGVAKGRPAGGALRQGLLHLQRLRFLPPVAVRSSGRDSSLRQPAKRGT